MNRTDIRKNRKDLITGKLAKVNLMLPAELYNLLNEEENQALKDLTKLAKFDGTSFYMTKKAYILFKKFTYTLKVKYLKDDGDSKK